MESGGTGLWVAFRSGTFSAFLFSRLKNSLEGIDSFEEKRGAEWKTAVLRHCLWYFLNQHRFIQGQGNPFSLPLFFFVSEIFI